MSMAEQRAVPVVEHPVTLTLAAPDRQEPLIKGTLAATQWVVPRSWRRWAAVAVALERQVRLVLVSHHRGRAAQVWHRSSPVRPLPVAVAAVVVTGQMMLQVQVRLVVLAAAVKVATTLAVQVESDGTER
jgi:hypothetical protein